MLTRTNKAVTFVSIILLLLLVFAWLGNRPRAHLRAQRQETKAQIKALGQATSLFALRMGRLPVSEVELFTNAAAVGISVPTPPWLDAWGHPLIYEPFATNAGLGTGRIISYGRDGRPGRDENSTIEDADIVVWF